MTPLPHAASRAAAFAVLATTAIAQVVPPPPTQTIVRQGPFSVWPVGIVENAAGQDKLLYVPPAQRSAAPAEYAHPDRPDYSVGALFPHLDPEVRAAFQFAAIDTGNSMLPTRTNWTVKTASGVAYGLAPDLRSANRWLALTATVTRDSPLVSHPLLTAGQGAHLFSYFFLESQDVPSSLLGALHIEQTAAQMMLSTNAEISAFDFGLGLLMASPEDDDLRAYAPWDDRLYFTVTQEFVQVYTALQTTTGFADDGTGVFVPPHAATIYCSTWDAGAGTWRPPTEFKTYTCLGLLADDAIDALAVDAGSEIVIFSTVLETPPRRDEVLVHNPAITVHPLPSHLTLCDHDGVKVSTRYGLTEDDDVDGLCGSDPEIDLNKAGLAAGTPKPFRYQDLHLQQGPGYNGMRQPIGFSIARDAPSLPDFNLRLQITGWGYFEQPVPCNVYLSVRMESPSGGGYAWGPWTTLPAVPRTATQHTWELTWPISASLASSVRRVEVDAILMCSDENQHLHALTGAIVPYTDPNATPLIGATWPLQVQFNYL